MVKRTDKELLLNRLDHVLDVFGADMSRWSHADLQDLRSFVREDHDARVRMDEAVAFHQVLNLSTGSEASASLKARILSDAADRASGDAALNDKSDQILEDQHSAHRPETAQNLWPVAGIFAASLALGLYLGVTGLSADILDGAFQFAGYQAGFGSDGDSEIASLLTSISLEDRDVLAEDL